MKRVLLIFIMMFTIISNCFASCDVWKQKDYNFNDKKRVSVVYEIASIYEGSAIEKLTREKFENYVDNTVKVKFKEKGYSIERDSCVTSGSDLIVKIYLSGYEEGKKYVDGFSFAVPTTQVSTYTVPGTFGVGQVITSGSNVVSVPGYDEKVTLVHVDYCVVDNDIKQKVLIVNDKAQCSGHNVVKGFEKSLKNFWKIFERNALK